MANTNNGLGAALALFITLGICVFGPATAHCVASGDASLAFCTATFGLVVPIMLVLGLRSTFQG